MRISLIVILLILFIGPVTLEGAERVDDFALLDQEGVFHQLSQERKQKAVVMMSYGIGCPIARKNLVEFHRLAAEFASSSITFWLIDANPQDRHELLIQEAIDYEIKIPILEDPSGIITPSLGISRTADIVVLDPKENIIVYHGPLDDQLGYETQKPTVQSQYLRDALIAILQQQPVEATSTPAKGCLINFSNEKKWNYTEDVVPILERKCLTCHSPNGSAPWVMDGYEKVKGWGPMIREVIRTRRMPPWHADSHFLPLKNDLSLTDQDVQTLVRWVEQGMSFGPGRDPLPHKIKQRHSDWVLGEPDLVFKFSESQDIPANGTDFFAVIQAEEVVQDDIWIKALEVKPGNARVVHHCNILIQYDPRDQQVENTNTIMPGSQQAYKNSGLETHGSGQEIAGYSPGIGAVQLPENTGIFIPKGSKIIFRMHYITTGKKEQDLSKVGFYLHHQKPQNVFSAAVMVNRDIQIPPGERAYARESEYVFKDPVTLFSIQPHMHYRGKSMRFTAIDPEGSKTVLLSVPHYQFTWQRLYELAEPLRLRAGTRILLEGLYDNSDLNPMNPDPTQTVGYGVTSGAEMFTGVMFYVKDSPADH